MTQLRTRGAAAEAELGVVPLSAVADGTPPARTASDTATLAAATGVAASSAAAGDEDDEGLVALARQLADEEGRLILTFATPVYDPLCRNFVAHMRRLRLRSYLLATFSRTYHTSLAARGERPHLHELTGLSSGGSDVFASRDFFLINSARYTVLTRLLRAGLHVFSCDLDVALLRNPLPAVWAAPYDLQLQSDARDAVSLVEASPFLLRDRLHLPAPTAAVTYVNGGVFFARGTHAVARLFEDTWAMASQDLGTLNEQDCLNRMLLASSLRWAPLPPRLFPNGYVYFRRPLPPPAGGDDVPATAESTVLVHCNWINGIAAKRYQLREALVWAGDGDEADGNVVSPGGLSSERLLTYTVGQSPDARTLGAQVRALCVALALATVSNRTLVMPVFYVLSSDSIAGDATGGGTGDGMGNSAGTASLPEAAAAEAREAQAEGRRGFTFLFEYAPFLRHFPHHRESSVLRAQWRAPLPAALSLPSAVTTSSVDEVDGVEGAEDTAAEKALVSDSAEEADANIAEDAAAHDPGGSTAGAAHELRQWLRQHQDQPLLRLHGLHRVPMGTIFARRAERAAFDARLRLALQPAPELRVISHHIVTKIHAHLHRLAGVRMQTAADGRGRTSRVAEWRRRASRRGHGQLILEDSTTPLGAATTTDASDSRTRSTQDFNCLHVTAAELASPNRLRAAASAVSLDVPTLLVMEQGANGAAPPLRAATSSSDGGVPTAAVLPRHTKGEPLGSNTSWVRAPLPTAAFKVFATPMHVGAFYPFWDFVEVDDVAEGRTLAYDLIQQLVCSAARRVHGNAGSEFVHGVCHWRRTAVFSKLLGSRRGTEADICSTLWEG